MNAPLVRFKEFNSMYQQHKLENLLIEDIKNGTQNNPGLNEDKIKFINVINLYSQIIEHKDLSYIVKDLKKIEHLLVEKGDLFYTRSSITVEGIAHCNIYNDSYSPVTFDDHIMRVRINTSVAFPDYVRLYSISQPSRKYLMATAKTGTMTTIGQGELKKLIINLPEMNEQEKISELFQKLNRKIKLQQDKIDLLKKQKKGYTQKIFSQELRFKNEDGLDFPNWNLKKVNTLFEKSSDKNTKLCFDKHKIISVASMKYKDEPKESSDDYMKTYNILRENEIAFEGNKSKNFKYGRFVLNDIGDGIVSHVFIVFKPKQIFDQKFLKEYINNEVVMQKILLHSTTSTLMMTSLNTKEFLEKSLPIPSIEEQIKIGEFLSAFEKRILSEEKKLSLLNLQKQALMQQMFI